MKKALFPLAVFLWILSCRMVNISNDLLEVRTGEHNLSPGGEIVFENTNGDLDLTEWDRDYIQVEASIYGDSSRGVPEDLDILIEESMDQLKYLVEYPGGLSFVSVDFSVRVPEDMEYDVASITVNGETRICASAFINVESVNGDIYVEALSSSGIETVNGDIEAILSRQLESFDIDAVNGDILLKIPEEIGVSVETLNGDISIDDKDYDHNAHVPGTLSGTVLLETVNGDVEVKRVD